MKVALRYLADIPLYEVEKPYYALLRPTEKFLAIAPGEHFKPEHQLIILKFETHDNIPIQNLRGKEKNFSVEEHGFEIMSHTSHVWENLSTPDDIAAYKAEVNELLARRFNAVHSNTFESRRRINKPFTLRVYNLGDPLLVEGPATGVHTNFTVNSGPKTVDNYLSEEAKKLYLHKPGYRFRIINTWRSLVPAVEDNPLAVCDTRTVDLADLVAADRIIPTRVGEVYYAKYNPNQHWYWLDKMTPMEPYLMVMYDSHARSNAAFCLHVSFQNAHAPKDAFQRASIETRSIVITKIET